MIPLANIRINALPATTSVLVDDIVPMDGATTRKIKPLDMLNSIRPISTQSQAEAGTDNTTSMTPLATAQSIAAKLPNTAAGRAMLSAANPAAQRALLVLGDAALANVGSTPGTVAAGDDIRFAGVAGIVDQATAEAGTDNAGLMSPLRVSQHLQAHTGAAEGTVAAGNDSRFSFTQAGSGSIIRSLQGKLRDVVSIKDFGAAGDGIQDDSPAVQDAVNYIAGLTYGGGVYVPTGKYKLVTQITVPKNYTTIRLFGDGMASVFDVSGVTSPSAGAPAFYVGNDGTPAQGWHVFENLAFVGSGTVGKAVQLNYANGARFSKVRFNYMRTAVTATESYALRFSGCLFTDIDEYGIASTTASHNLIIDSGCQFLDVNNTGTYPYGAVVYLGGPTVNVVVRDSDFEGCGQILSLGTGQHESFIVEGNYFEYAAGWIINSGGEIRGLRMAANQINDCLDWSFPPCDGAVFQGNKVNAMAISFPAACKNVDVGHNTVDGGSIGPAPFISPTLTNSYVAGSRAPGYRRLANGTIELRGDVTSGLANNGMFTLPAGYRPTQEQRFPAIQTAGTGSMIVVQANGVVYSIHSAVHLDGIRFTAGQ